MTFSQLCSYGFKSKRTTKVHRSKSPRLEGCPHKKAVCSKVYITKPKKPNSARRQVAKVRITSTKKNTIVYIPGSGNNLQQHSVVLLRGGRATDLPGVKYRAIRGKYDFMGEQKFSRKNRRSKFSIKKPKKDDTVSP